MYLNTKRNTLRHSPCRLALETPCNRNLKAWDLTPETENTAIRNGRYPWDWTGCGVTNENREL